MDACETPHCRGPLACRSLMQVWPSSDPWGTVTNALLWQPLGVQVYPNTAAIRFRSCHYSTGRPLTFSRWESDTISSCLPHCRGHIPSSLSNLLKFLSPDLMWREKYPLPLLGEGSSQHSPLERNLPYKSLPNLQHPDPSISLLWVKGLRVLKSVIASLL